MSYELIPEPPVEQLLLQTVQQVRDSEKMLYDILGYRGSLSTTTHETDGVTTESARLDLVVDGGVPVNAAIGDVIVYRTTPAPVVVECMSQEAFAAKYRQKT